MQTVCARTNAAVRRTRSVSRLCRRSGSLARLQFFFCPQPVLPVASVHSALLRKKFVRAHRDFLLIKSALQPVMVQERTMPLPMFPRARPRTAFSCSSLSLSGGRDRKRRRWSSARAKEGTGGTGRSQRALLHTQNVAPLCPLSIRLLGCNRMEQAMNLTLYLTTAVRPAAGPSASCLPFPKQGTYARNPAHHAALPDLDPVARGSHRGNPLPKPSEALPWRRIFS